MDLERSSRANERSVTGTMGYPASAMGPQLRAYVCTSPILRNSILMSGAAAIVTSAFLVPVVVQMFDNSRVRQVSGRH